MYSQWSEVTDFLSIFHHFLQIEKKSLLCTQISGYNLFQDIVLLHRTEFFKQIIVFYSQFSHFFPIDRCFSGICISLELTYYLSIFNRNFIGRENKRKYITQLIIHLHPHIAHSSHQISITIGIKHDRRVQYIQLPDIVIEIITQFRLFKLLISFRSR